MRGAEAMRAAGVETRKALERIRSSLPDFDRVAERPGGEAVATATVGGLRMVSDEKIHALTVRQVCKLLGIGETTFHQKVKRQDDFPRPVQLRQGVTRYIDAEIRGWLLSRERVEW